MKFTHKGWFFMCPVYLNADEGEGMHVDARWAWLDWWFTINEGIFACMVFVMTAINADYEPAFPFVITGEITHKDSGSEL